MSARTSAPRTAGLRRFSLAALAVCAVALFAAAVTAQIVAVNPASTDAEPLQVVIEREPLLIRSPETYKVSLHLDPIKTILLAAQVDGVVGDVLVKMGQAVQAQELVVRLDSRDRQLELNRAKAALEVALISQQGAQQALERDLAAAELKVAEIDVQLAQYRVDQSSLRAPFKGIVQRVHAVPGQFVRAGEPLATLIDPTQLQVEVPVDRNTVKDGDRLAIQVEQRTANGTVQGILPLTERFEPLRELFESVATGVVILDNSGDRFQPGQTVYASMIPRQPVVEIPNRAIGNTDEGTRRVQVIRDGFIRNVAVELLGAVGEEQTIVTGRFGNDDELIVQSSEELLDGTQVVPRAQLEAASGEPRTTGGSTPVRTRPPRGF